ncbi:hypothetical protein CSKR_102720 [Clonorchis sinensis]|uniref:Uncharacterized protein n=1 Tax=Clonorchis sinensis TaxID=79923 RepID=A0A3R7DI39_CLOSI|nr:hypothetical protein CSKR_102720 [Clonorchis sinensis]
MPKFCHPSSLPKPCLHIAELRLRQPSSNTETRLSSAAWAGRVSQPYNKTARTVAERDRSLADSCIDLICLTTIRTDATSNVHITLRKFVSLPLDSKWHVQAHSKGWDDPGQFAKKQLRFFLRFEDENDVRILRIDKVVVRRLKTGVQKTLVS